MVRIGFSTHHHNPLSWLIRTITGSDVSHAWLLLDDSVYGLQLVMEATEGGFRLIPFETFRRSNEVVYLFNPAQSLEAGARQYVNKVGSGYDYAGLFGTIFVLIGRWFHKRIRNPFRSTTVMFCSEAVVDVMQASGYPGTSGMDPDSVTPEDLLKFLRSDGSSLVDPASLSAA